MDLFNSTNKKIQRVSRLNFIFITTLLMIPIIFHVFGEKTYLFILAFIITLYPFANLISAYSSLDIPITKNDLSLLSISALLFGFFNTFNTLYLVLDPQPGNIYGVHNLLSAIVAYLTPCLTLFAIVLACQSVDSGFSVGDFLRLLAVSLTSFIIVILIWKLYVPIISWPYQLVILTYYISIGLTVILYLKFLHLLWNRKNTVNRFSYAYIHVLFMFLLVNESLKLGLRNYGFLTKDLLLFLLMVYIFFTIQFQCHIVKNHFYLAKKESLFKKSSDIMSQFLTLKNLQVENLETEISTSSTLYKQLFDSSPDAFIMFNDNKVLYSNHSLVKLLGAKDEKDFSSKKIWDFIHPHSMASARSIYHKLSSGKETISIKELKLLSLNHQVKRVKVSSSIAFYDNTFCILCCCHDLSSHYKQKLAKAELEKDVADEKFKVEFFADISHDLKTPINVIYSAVQLQDMYTVSKDYDGILMYNNIIRQNCLRLQKLLNDILDTTKIDANHFKPKLELCNIIPSIEYITGSITSFIKDKDISIIFDTNVEYKYVMADLGLIERILLNLISNAIKYGNQNGYVWVNLYDEGDHLIISIKDDGIGIPENQIPKLFNRFHRGDHTTDTTTSSNGIGLSLVKSIVEMLGGTISCLSKEGVGSEFIVILPMESHNGDELNHLEYAASLDLNNNLNIELSDL